MKVIAVSWYNQSDNASYYNVRHHDNGGSVIRHSPGPVTREYLKEALPKGPIVTSSVENWNLAMSLSTVQKIKNIATDEFFNDALLKLTLTDGNSIDLVSIPGHLKQQIIDVLDDEVRKRSKLITRSYNNLAVSWYKKRTQVYREASSIGYNQICTNDFLEETLPKSTFLVWSAYGFNLALYEDLLPVINHIECDDHSVTFSWEYGCLHVLLPKKIEKPATKYMNKFAKKIIAAVDSHLIQVDKSFWISPEQVDLLHYNVDRKEIVIQLKGIKTTSRFHKIVDDFDNIVKRFPHLQKKGDLYVNPTMQEYARKQFVHSILEDPDSNPTLAKSFVDIVMANIF